MINLEKKRILVAEDSPNMKFELLAILNQYNAKSIFEADNGIDAYNELLSQANYGTPYDIVFSDINMPKLNGIQLLTKTRQIEHYKKIPFFIVSTENEKGIILKAVMAGATDYILKPYNPGLVKEKLLKHLAHQITTF